MESIMTPVAESPLPFCNYSISATASTNKNIPIISITNRPETIIPEIKLPSSVVEPVIGIFDYTRALVDNELGDMTWSGDDLPIPLLANSVYCRVGCIAGNNGFFHSISKALSKIYQMSYAKFDTISEEVLVQFEKASGGAVYFPSSLFTTPRYINSSNIYQLTSSGKVKFNRLMIKFREHSAQLLRRDLAKQILENQNMQSLIFDKLSDVIFKKSQRLSERALASGTTISRETATFMSHDSVLKKLASRLLCDEQIGINLISLLSDYVGVDIYVIGDKNIDDFNTISICNDSILNESVRGSYIHSQYHENKNALERKTIILVSFSDGHYELIARVDMGIDTQIISDLPPNEPIVKKLYELLLRKRLAR